MCRGADDDGTGLGDGLQARRDVRGLAERQRLAPARSADLANHDQTRVDADPDRERDPLLALESCVQWSERFDDPDGGANGAARIILPGDRIAEVHEQTIAEVLGDVAVELADHGVTDPLIGPDHVAQLLGIEPRGQLSRADEVAEHHRELAAFGLRGRSRLVTSRCPAGSTR
jgi:hypothetical protein